MKEAIEELIAQYEKSLRVCKKTWSKYPYSYNATEENLLESIIADLTNLLKSAE